jgi:hypothetical protein
MLGDKMYVAWEDNGYLLFEVTVNNNNNYVSHVVLGNLPRKHLVLPANSALFTA